MRDKKASESNVHLLLQRELWTRVRMQALTEGRPAVELVADALMRYLERKDAQARGAKR